MALVKVGYAANIKMVDAGGNVSYFRPGVVGADHATALTNTQTIVAQLDVLTDALVAGYSVSEVYAEDTLQYGGGEVENIADVVVPIDGKPGKYHTFRIPAPVSGLFVGTEGPDYNKVNTGSATLTAFIESFTDKTGYTAPGAAAIATISELDTVKPDNTNDKPYIEGGKRIHRASRKG